MEFTSPPPGVQYERLYTAIQIPWKFNNDGSFAFVNYYYKKSGSPADQWKNILVVNYNGKTTVPSESDQFKNRLELKGNFANKRRIDATLMINDFMKQDEGDFKCEVKGEDIWDREITIRAVGMIYVP